MNKNIFKNEFWRQKWIMFATFAFMFLIIIIRSNIYDSDYYGTSGFVFFFMYTSSVAFLIPTIVFKYLHSKEKLDLINSLPVTRKEMFLYKYFIGLLYFTIPFFVAVVSILVLDSFNYLIPIDFSLAFFLLIIKYYLLNVLVYSITTLAIVLTGMFVYSMLGGLYLLLLPVLVFIPFYIIFDIYNRMFKNVYVYYSDWLDNIVTYIFTNNFKDLVGGGDLYFAGEYLLQIVVLLAINVALTFFALTLYKMRKTEKATSVLVFDKSKVLITYIISIPISGLITVFIMGVIFHNYYYATRIFITFFITFFVVTLIVEILINKGLKNIKKKKSLINFAIIYGVIAMLLIFTSFNINWFLPKNSNVYKEIQYYTNKPADNKNLETGEIFLTDELQIENFNDLIKDILKDMPKYLDEDVLNEKDVVYSVTTNGLHLVDISHEQYEKIKQFDLYNTSRESVMLDVIQNYDNLRYNMYEYHIYGTFNENIKEINNNYLYKRVRDYKIEMGIETNVYTTNPYDIEVDDELLKESLIYDLQNYKKEFNNFELIPLAELNVFQYDSGDVDLYTNINSEHKEVTKLLSNYFYDSNYDSFGFNKKYEVYKTGKAGIKAFSEAGYNANDSIDGYLLENQVNIELVESFETKNLIDGKNDIYILGGIGRDNNGSYAQFLENIDEKVKDNMYLIKESQEYYVISYYVGMYYDDIIKYKSVLE